MFPKAEDGIAEQGDAQEDKEDLVRLSSKNSNSGFFLKDIDAGHEEQRRTKVDGQGNSQVTHDVEPAGDPGSDSTPFRRGKHESLVVNT